MANFTKGNINDLEANPAWLEIVHRFQKLEKAADEAMKNDDLAKNRRATGERDAFQAILRMPATLRKELE